MDKRFKLKFPRVIPLIQFCRPKHNSTRLEKNPIVPAIYRRSPLIPKVLDIGYPSLFPAPPPSTPESPSTKRQVSTNTKSVGCGCSRSKSWSRLDFSNCIIESPEHNAPTHLVTEKYYNKKHKSSSEKKTRKAKACLTSSENSKHWFSSEEEDEESQTPMYSSRSFSTDFSAVLETISEKSEKYSRQKGKKSNSMQNNTKVRRMKRSISKKWKEADKATGENGKLKSVFQPMRACRRTGMVNESMAVVKKSEDPYEDFKRSMMEMVMEKQIFEAKELEELLHCFLSLNSHHYQGVIVEAFSEIWKILFTDTPSTSSEFYCFADKSQQEQLSNLKI